MITWARMVLKTATGDKDGEIMGALGVSDRMVYLRNGKGQFAHRCHDSLWLAPICITLPFIAALERRGIKVMRTLDLAGLVGQDAQRLAGPSRPWVNRAATLPPLGGFLRASPFFLLL